MSVLKFALTSKRDAIHRAVTKVLGEPIAYRKDAYAVWAGEMSVALVSHIDTVLEHNKRPLHLIWTKNKISGKFGLGADDRAGVGMILTLLRAGLKPWVILCDDEELGCMGATALATDYPQGFDISAMIELDRRGSNDAVYYDMDTSTPDAAALRYFVEYQAGFTKEWGSFSDISVLAPAWSVAAVNLSVGYYNEHTVNEFLVPSEWRNNVKRVGEILKSMQLAEVGRLEYIEDSVASYMYGSGFRYSKKNYGNTSGLDEPESVWDKKHYKSEKDHSASSRYHTYDTCWCGTALIEGYCPNCDRYPYLGELGGSG